MSADNTNTRLFRYIGNDPELRKYIHTWDSMNYEFDERDNEKYLYPKCGYGYAVHRNVKDIYIKMPPHPYNGDVFAIMDITHVNDEYIQSKYYDNNILPKETPITNNLTLTTANIVIDNTYNDDCNTRIVYDTITYHSGSTFVLNKTCCYLYMFLYSKTINAWVVNWLEKECEDCAEC